MVFLLSTGKPKIRPTMTPGGKKRSDKRKMVEKTKTKEEDKYNEKTI